MKGTCCKNTEGAGEKWVELSNYKYVYYINISKYIFFNSGSTLGDPCNFPICSYSKSMRINN